MNEFNYDPRNPSNHYGIVSCGKCGSEYDDGDYHECETITDET